MWASVTFKGMSLNRIYSTIFRFYFLPDYDVESNLQPIDYGAMQRTLQPNPNFSSTERLQFFFDCNPPSRSKSDLGPMGLPTAQEDPPAKILPGSKCCLLSF